MGAIRCRGDCRQKNQGRWGMKRHKEDKEDIGVKGDRGVQGDKRGRTLSETVKEDRGVKGERGWSQGIQR